ncbi:MAG: serine protease, subtilase family, partial [Myxococcaceae bacterium]|nr:serine protease, subtilase family [Myxococcaceae bacterium]
MTDRPPELSLEAPAEGLLVTTTQVEVKGTASDDDAAPAVEVSVNEGGWTKVALGAAGAFSTGVTLPQSDATPSAISVRAIDSKGREVKVTRRVTVDNVPPACAVTNPAEAAVITSVGILAVTLSASDGSPTLVDPRLSTDGALTFTTLPGDGGSYTFDWDVGSGNGAPRELVFRVDDSAGHTCEAKRAVTVDNVKPTVGFASPDAGSLLGPAF